MNNVLRSDLFAISKLIKDEEKILDVGCGDGNFNLIIYQDLKKALIAEELKIKQSGVNSCVKKGLSVIQGDANYDLNDYPNNAFQR